MKALLVSLLLGSMAVAEAAVYRCEREGKPFYTDQPCAAGAEPAKLPALNGLPAERDAPDLAQQFDADAKKNTDALAEADRDWLKKHEAAKAHEDKIRKALVENHIIKGMTPAQVRQVLHQPDTVEDQGGPKERWTWQNGRERRTIAFKEGVVFSDTLRSARK